MKKTLFIKNAALLTATSILLRVLGLVFKVWTAAKIGDGGIGLYTVVFSVYAFAGAFASAGLCTAVTRLCAQADEKDEDGVAVLKKCLLASFGLGTVSLLLAFSFSPFIATRLIAEPDASQGIKIIAVCLPFLGISSCFRGYFIAIRKASPCAVSQIFEQSVRILFSFLLVRKYAVFGTAAAVSALAAGDAAAEILCAGYLCLRFKAERKNARCGLHKSTYGYAAIFRIAFPITCGRYGSVALRTTENVLVPRMFAIGLKDQKSGLSVFGNIKGMALPVLLFPATLVTAVSSLLIPEISAARLMKRRAVVKGICEEILKLTLCFSLFFAVLFAETGNAVGMLLYKSRQVGFLLLALSPLVPLMYLDCVSDGILKGLDCQKFSFFLGVADSGIRVAAIVLLLPRFGIYAFLGIMYFSNFFTAFLNTSVLIKKSGAVIDPFRFVFLPLLLAVASVKIPSYFLRAAVTSDLVYIILLITVSCLVYFSLLIATKSVTTDELKACVR